MRLQKLSLTEQHKKVLVFITLLSFLDPRSWKQHQHLKGIAKRLSRYGKGWVDIFAWWFTINLEWLRRKRSELSNLEAQVGMGDQLVAKFDDAARHWLGNFETWESESPVIQYSTPLDFCRQFEGAAVSGLSFIALTKAAEESFQGCKQRGDRANYVSEYIDQYNRRTSNDPELLERVLSTDLDDQLSYEEHLKVEEIDYLPLRIVMLKLCDSLPAGDDYIQNILKVLRNQALSDAKDLDCFFDFYK